MRVLVVDDHEFVRKGICALLATDPNLTICAQAVDGIDAVEKAQALRPDVVVMDISMPRMNGLDATREIKRRLPETEIVIVSQHAAVEMFRQAVSAGARAYVVKSSIATDLLEAIARVSRRETFVVGVEPDGTNPNLDSQEILQRSAALEKALRESEERFRSAMNNMAEGLYTFDTDGLVTYINPSAEAVFGWSSAELLGKKMHDVTHYKHPDGTPFPAADCPGFQVLQKGGVLREHEDTFFRKDGSPFPVVFSASPLRINGTTRGVVVSFRDDTERREAEEALRRTTAHFRLVADTMAVAVTRCSRDLRYLWVNPRYSGWIGKPAEEIVGHPIVEILGDEAFERLRPRFEQVLRGESISFDERIPFKGVGARWISAAYEPTFDSRGVPDGWVASIVDITERSRAEQALRDSEERFRAIVETTPECVKLLTENGTLLYMNLPGLTMVGAASAEVVLGKNVYDIIAPHDRERYRAFNERICRGERGSLEFDIVALDGRGRHLETHAAPFRMTDGSLVHLAVSRDITQQVRVQEQLRASEERLRSWADELEMQVVNRTRELEERNAEVLHQSEQLRELSNRLLQTQNDERRRIARELHDSAGQIVAALSMNLARITPYVSQDPELGRIVDDNQDLIQQLNKEIRTAAYLLHPPLLDETGLPGAIQWYARGLAERGSLNIDLVIPDDFGRLPRDMELTLFRVIQECLTNVHRHSGSATAEVRMSRNDGTVLLEIQDEGKGISAEKLDAIHEQRSGVGIMGMRERVRSFKGTMNIHSNGNGTKISVTLPVLTADISPEDDALQEQASEFAG